MAKQLILKADTSRVEYMFVPAATKTDGSGCTGLSATMSGLKAFYVRSTPGGVTSISLVTCTGSATADWRSGALLELSATSMPGLYRFDIPDAVFATGCDKAVVQFWGTSTDIQPSPVLMEYQLVSFDPENAVTLGLSGLSATELSTMPGAATTLAAEVQFIYQSVRNRRDSGTASQNMYTDGGTIFATATQSDSGTLFVKGKFG